MCSIEYSLSAATFTVVPGTSSRVIAVTGEDDGWTFCVALDANDVETESVPDGGMVVDLLSGPQPAAGIIDARVTPPMANPSDFKN
jgi:hypothetical protein